TLRVCGGKMWMLVSFAVSDWLCLYFNFVSLPLSRSFLFISLHCGGTFLFPCSRCLPSSLIVDICSASYSFINGTWPTIIDTPSRFAPGVPSPPIYRYVVSRTRTFSVNANNHT
ncbi:hypothetical protein B0H19DRAFT_1199882, partial [Mycena capillaripes]